MSRGRVVVIGATGVLGRRAGPALVRAGHDVTALVRADGDADAVSAWGARPARGDLLARATLDAAVRGADVVVNLASAIPTVAAPEPADWTRNDRVRRDGTRNLLAAAAGARVRHYVHTSVYLVYGDDLGDDPVDESAPVRPAPALRSAADAEAMVRAAGGADWTILRPGWLYDAGAWHTVRLLEALRAGTAAVLEGVTAWRSPVHAADVARAVALVVDRRPAGETFNVADGCPVPNRELLDGLAELLGAPRPPRVTAREAGVAAAVLRRSARLSTDRIIRWGFTPQYPSWREGFAEMLGIAR